MIKIGKISNPNEYIYHDTYVEMKIHSPTFGDFNILFDKEDYEKVSQYQWCINKCWNKNSNIEPAFYVGTSSGENNNSLLLHRFITNCPKGYVVDHINHNELDNRKENLRICTQSENKMNTVEIQHNNKSGHKGVFWDTHIPTPKWKAFIKVKQKYYHLGYYTDINDAIIARKKAEEKYFGEYANKIHKLN